MDLVSSGSRVVVTMEHTAKGGKPKILNACRLPLTGTRCVNAIITEMGVFDVCPKEGLTLVEIAEDTTVEKVKAATEAPFEGLTEMKTLAQRTQAQRLKSGDRSAGRWGVVAAYVLIRADVWCWLRSP